MFYPTITGLDIGHHSIKAVSVRLKRGQLQLLGYHEVLLPETAFLDINTLQLGNIKPQLSLLKKSLKLSQKKVAFSIPDSCIMSKIIQIDSQLDEKEIEFTLTHTFEKQTSLSSDDLSLDFTAIDQRGIDKPKTTTYQVIATRKEIVQSRQKCVESAGLSAVLADVHSHALFTLWQRGVQTNPGKKNWMLIDIGHLQTIFCITSPNQHLYSKQITFGASIQEDEIKRETLASIHLESHSQYIAQLSEHIRRQITLYSSIHNHRVEGIWITGGGSLFPDLSHLLSAEISLPISEFNLISLFQESNTQLTSVNPSINQYASALGLALRGVEWLIK